MKKGKIMFWILLFFLIVGAIAYMNYREWRAQFIVPSEMMEDEPGVFKSHPDNFMPDKKAKMPFL